MKILDRYILTTYLKTFISVFVILMLIFVLQAIWLYIKELAGKDLDLVTVLKFLMYITPTLIPLILPLTILLASIMVFGNFAENYEFAAMKSTGISLQRAMSGLGIFIVGLSILTFFFSNNVIPWAEYNSYNLRKNIAKVKPAMIIAEGQFNDIGESFNIKVQEKSGENGKLLKGVTIHKKSGKSFTGNFTTIIAERGELASAEDSNILKLILYDGNYYDDTPPKKIDERKKKPFRKAAFKKHVMNLDLSKLNNIDLNEKNIDDKYTMLNVAELNYAIDSLKIERNTIVKEFSTALYNRTNLATLNLTVNPKKDSTYTGDILDIFKDKRKIQVLDYAINSTSSTQQIIKSKQATLKVRNTTIYKHGIQMHKKFALAIACIILFFVGAPLGALIRKGGLGLPMIIAIVLFLSYHFIGLFAENSAKNGNLHPALSAWFSTLIMLPLSIFLTTRATQDRGIFEFDHITQPIKNWYNQKFNRSAQFEALNGNTPLVSFEEKDINNYKTLSKITSISFGITVVLGVLYFVLKNNKLPQFAEAGIQFSAVAFIIFLYNYIKSSLAFDKLNALTKNKKETIIQKTLGAVIYPLTHFFRVDKITFGTNYNPVKTNNSKDLYSETPITLSKNDSIDFRAVSKLSFLFFSIALILFLSYFILKNNEQPQLALAGIQISIISFIVFVFNYIKSYLEYVKLLKTIKHKKEHPLFTLLGVILYPLIHFNRRQKIDA
ncbi:LptF/LptG family permease [Psychroserpens sp. NJDZ02]|uniref:LptF/LptG family permease n=1 Tax=Psychroserpens sp. NJDZ02 TaxID=2570561 RepID=UPI0010A8AFDD|nr:LptF/LptG family permease [Psychroserpens sp. NJDZ02]QCE43302.1 YjgP/YjgQ family permease [Psychroserpens sp. NJDZ02]